MKKKLVACLLTAAMTVSLAACGGGSGDGNNSNNSSNPASSQSSDGSSTGSGLSVSGEYEEVELDGITYHKAKDLTTDEIELVFYHYMDQETVQYLCDRWNELYPNIHAKPAVNTGEGDYLTALGSMLQSGEAPDIIQYTDADTALINGYLYDMTDLWNSDPETDELPDTIKDRENGFGTFSTGHRFSAPAKYYPGIMFADRNVFKKLNVDLPGQDWTWSQMIDLIKKCTKVEGGVQYFGLGALNRLDSYYGIASSQDVLGEFGYDGKDFDLSAWAVGEEEFAGLKHQGYVAPAANSQEAEEQFGAWDAWFGATGQVALFSEGFWTFQNIWNTKYYLENMDLDIIPYVIPAVSEADASSDHHSIATIEGGGICSATKHPREAYELMKFLFWGRDGWLTRIQLYESHATGYTTDGGLEMGGVDENGNDKVEMKNKDMFCPITTNEEVWAAYKKVYCEGMDDEHVKMWNEYFASCMHPISFGWHSIAGYWNACNEYFNALTATDPDGVGRVGIHEIVDHNAGKAADYVDECTTKFNYYHAKAMIDYFGPNSFYNILTDDQVAEYEQMMAANDSGASTSDTQ